MCFSAKASFIAGSALTAIGIAALIINKDKSKLWLAATPFLFGLQQLAEGFVWLSHLDSEFYSYREAASKSFLFFAQVVWPFWIPFSLGSAEKDPERKKKIGYLLWIGAALSAVLLARLFVVDVNSSIEGHHVSYTLLATPTIIMIGGIIYLLPTIFSFRYSSVKYAKLLGFLTLLAYIITRVFYEHHVLSTWCYFSALLSVIILFMLRTPVLKRAE